jgi:hypothetical protein
MAKFKVAVQWMETAEIEIEAESLKEAMQKAKDADLPDNGEYLTDSFEVNEDFTFELNGGRPDDWDEPTNDQD